MTILALVIGAVVILGIGVAIGASGDPSRPYRHQLAAQREANARLIAERDRLRDTAAKLAVSNAELRANDDRTYFQGWSDREAFITDEKVAELLEPQSPN